MVLGKSGERSASWAVAFNPAKAAVAIKSAAKNLRMIGLVVVSGFRRAAAPVWWMAGHPVATLVVLSPLTVFTKEPAMNEEPMTDKQCQARLDIAEMLIALLIADLKDRGPAKASRIAERLDAKSQGLAWSESTAVSDAWLAVLRGEQVLPQIRF